MRLPQRAALVCFAIPVTGAGACSVGPDFSFGCDDPCGMNATCIGGKCEPGCSKGTCPADMFCPSTGFTDFPTCQPGCDGDAECDPGTLCRQGKCLVNCRASTDCPTGHPCFVGFFRTDDPKYAGCDDTRLDACATCSQCTCAAFSVGPTVDGGVSNDAAAD
jgi:hypothetical protein